MAGAAGYAIVLLVNDNPTQLNALHLFLASEGFSVWPAESAESALGIMQNSVPDLIISDVVMPGIDGINLCRRIKSDPSTDDIPILLISGLRYDDASVADGLDAGADDYLEIDAPPSLLVKKAQRLVAQAREKRGRLQAEAALKESEERFRSLIEATFDGIVIHRDGLIFEANQGFARMFGYELSEVIGRHITDFADEQHRDTIIQNIRSGGVHNYEAVGVRKDGTRINLELFGKDHVYKMERVRVTALRDITREKQLQASLRHSETMAAMGQLVAGVAHEVRNPLFSISSILDAFEARFADRAEYQRYTGILRRELDRLNHLMQDLLEYGAPASRELQRGPIESVIAQAIRSSAALADKSGVQIISAGAGELAPVLMDRRRLPQVFVNLLENAIHHSPPGETVTVEARQVIDEDRNWIECSIKDSGRGFCAEELDKIFDPFFTKRRGGTGLGLSIAERIIEAHGGRISAANRPEGGAVITVSLPAEAGHSQGKEERAGGKEQDSDH